MEKSRSGVAKLAVAAVGVVYGDIGTSPLYAMRSSFQESGLPVDELGVLGILSFITWTLLLVVSLKYLVFVLRADHEGEGGILALTALLDEGKRHGRRATVLLLMGLFGAALLYGDGMITPAISVLSAVEGVEVATPAFAHWVLPTTIAILVALFAAQRFGTAKIGAVFGPLMIVWFLVLAVLGGIQIVAHPGVLRALSPHYAVELVARGGFPSLAVLGGVFLVATGAEALYADLGHFGRRPIRVAWSSVVLPCLLLSYFGQGALLLAEPEAIANPFFHMAPDALLYPLIGLATMATVIASQAVIAGAFSLTYQAIQLGFVPRIEVRHTSAEEHGQIYVPTVNWLLMVCTIALVLGFGSSSRLASAYGVAVTTTMVITTVLTFVLARRAWGWGWARSLLFLAGFLVIDVAFFAVNVLKIPAGGWFPLTVAALILLMFTTWQKGRAMVQEQIGKTPVSELLERLRSERPARVPGVGVFMSASRRGTPAPLLHHLEHLPALHQTVLLLTVEVEDRPRVSVGERVTTEALGEGLFRVIVRVGYVQEADIPAALTLCEAPGLDLEDAVPTYYFGHETVVYRPGGMSRWREGLFSALGRLTSPATLHFGVPTEQVVEVGARVGI